MGHKKLAIIAPVAALLFGIAGFTATTYAAEPAAACQELTAQQSDDKSHYNIVATATAPSGTNIVGYQFDFGDRESYTFRFGSAQNRDKNKATVKHTYKKDGTYKLSAKVISTKDGKTQTSSTGCVLSVKVGASATSLPDTGPSTATTVVLAVIIGFVTYGITYATQRGYLTRI
jgi:hypothetical protein